jgi:hypothetical protein
VVGGIAVALVLGVWVVLETARRKAGSTIPFDPVEDVRQVA